MYTSNNQLSHVTVTKITQSNILIVMKDINHRGYCVYGWWVSIEMLLTMSEVCDTPITNNHGGTNSPTRNRHYILPDEDLQCGRSVAINIRVIIARPNPHSGRGFQHLNLSLVRFDPIRLMRSKPQDAYLYKTALSPRVPRFQTSKQGRI